jgi:hypothetical protein
VNDAADIPRPTVPVGIHRRRQRRRQLIRWASWAAGALIVLSILLAIFVHEGLLGISGLVGAAVVAAFMLRPSQWRRLGDDDLTEE